MAADYDIDGFVAQAFALGDAERQAAFVNELGYALHMVCSSGHGDETQCGFMVRHLNPSGRKFVEMLAGMLKAHDEAEGR